MGTLSGSDGNDDVQERVARLEKRIELLERAVRGYGIPIPASYEGAPTEALVSPAVRQLAIDGRRIDAIKALVQETGMGLKEAKEIVERL
ncbi:MAG: 50S ribosomal protein L12 [Rhodococcus fascians]